MNGNNEPGGQFLGAIMAPETGTLMVLGCHGRPDGDTITISMGHRDEPEPAAFISLGPDDAEALIDGLQKAVRHARATDPQRAAAGRKIADMSDDQAHDIAFVRIQHYDTPDMQTYAAVRPAELPALLAGSDSVETVQQCNLDLPPDITGRLTDRLAAPLRQVKAIIGDVTGDTWVTGPLKGQPRPNPWFRLQGFAHGMAPGYRCTYVSPDGHHCDMVGEHMRQCPAHTPGTRWSELPDDDQDDDET
jgi:hypothetical protein